jgi:hypothetical protein
MSAHQKVPMQGLPSFLRALAADVDRESMQFAGEHASAETLRTWAGEVAALSSEAAAVPDGTVEYPKARDVGRIGDMGKKAHMRVGLDNENDVYVSVWDEDGGASVEFCTPGSGGGKSPKTRAALLALMIAMETDNTESPSRDWWAARGAKS